MAEKITKRMVMTEMLADDYVNTNVVWKDFLNNELVKLDKKSGGKSAEQIEFDNGLKATLTSFMSDKRAYNISKDIVGGEEFKGVSAQKITAILGEMIKVGKVTREVEKGTVYYRLS